MTDRDKLINGVRSQNAYATEAQIVVFVDALCEYRQAQKMISESSQILKLAGKPIENPWLSVRDKAAKTMLAARLKTKGLLL